MSNEEKLMELEYCIILSELGSNSYLTSRLKSLKEKLEEEYTMSEGYYNEIKEIIGG